MISLKIRALDVFFMDGITVADQTQVQAQVKAQVLSNDFNDFDKGSFLSCLRHIHEGFYSLLDLFKGLIPKRNQEAQV